MTNCFSFLVISLENLSLLFKIMVCWIQLLNHTVPKGQWGWRGLNRFFFFFPVVFDSDCFIFTLEMKVIPLEQGVFALFPNLSHLLCGRLFSVFLQNEISKHRASAKVTKLGMCGCHFIWKSSELVDRFKVLSNPTTAPGDLVHLAQLSTAVRAGSFSVLVCLVSGSDLI